LGRLGRLGRLGSLGRLGWCLSNKKSQATLGKTTCLLIKMQ
jgi:hypothetical protein